MARTTEHMEWPSNHSTKIISHENSHIKRHEYLTIYRVIQEESALLWEMIV
jgi:hypothetical protein